MRILRSMLIGMDCENSTGAHFDDVVGESGGVLPIMRDVHHRQPERALEPREFGSQVCAELWVQTREGLVQQQQARLADDRARECHALLLSAGELVRVPTRELLNANQRERVLCSPVSFEA
jgi:hypothetical protein